MIKFASSSISAPTKFRFPLPENLLELERRFSAAQSPDDKTAIAQEFTRLVAALRVGHICKTTRWGRLDRSLAQLVALVSPQEPQRLLDIGVSDGITTLEAVESLQRRCGVVTAVGIDLHCELVGRGGGLVTEYQSNRGDPVLARLGPFIMTVGTGASPRQPFSRWLANRYLARRGLRNKLQGQTRISLINPLARANRSIRFAAHDIFVPNQEWTDQFSIVRAANIFHREYFSEDVIRQIVRQLVSYLQEGGILLISRNFAPRESPGCEENGTLWRKMGDGLEPIAAVGEGSCVGELVSAASQA